LVRPVQGDTSPAGKRRDDGRDDRLGWAEPLFNDLDALHGAPSIVTVDEPWPGCAAPTVSPSNRCL
jgi:hypothetical protein